MRGRTRMIRMMRMVIEGTIWGGGWEARSVYTDFYYTQCTYLAVDTYFCERHSDGVGEWS